MDKKQHQPRWFFIGLIASLFISIASLFIVLLFDRAAPKKDCEYACQIYRESIELHYEGAKSDLVDAIDAYIDSVAPKSFIDGIVILEECDEYDVDIIFVLAQAQIESCFGTTGIAAKTNSVWNVGSADGKTAEQIKTEGKYSYSHPNKSIVPYLTLLKDRFLVNGKSEKDMMVKFTTKGGARYASATNYEDQLRTLYNKIYTTTDLKDKINEFYKFKSLKEN